MLHRWGKKYFSFPAPILSPILCSHRRRTVSKQRETPNEIIMNGGKMHNKMMGKYIMNGENIKKGERINGVLAIIITSTIFFWSYSCVVVFVDDFFPSTLLLYFLRFQLLLFKFVDNFSILWWSGPIRPLDSKGLEVH